MSEKIISVEGLKKTFGENEVLKSIDFSVEKGDVTCIIGSSGSGKSTLLRCINTFRHTAQRWKWFFRALIFLII